MGYKIYLCGDDDGRLVVPNPECPNAAEHTPMPPGYVERFEWANELKKTHRQVQCPECHLYNIWIPRTHPADSASGPRDLGGASGMTDTASGPV